MKNFVFSFVCAAMLFSASHTYAATGQYGSYGTPSDVEKVIIDKKIAYPVSKNGSVEYRYVDNLGVSDYQFSPFSYLFFKIKVTNTSGADLKGIVIKDTFPYYLQVFETVGSYDKNTRILTINAGDLKKGESKEYTLKARVYPSADLPEDKTLFCLTNVASAKTGDAYDEDSSQFCISHKQKEVEIISAKGGVIEVKEIPSTGAPGLLILAISGLAGLLGLKFKKYTG